MRFQKGHESILGLIDLILTLPASSADAERGFSEMKMTKTDWQTHLCNSVLNDILMVHFNTASVKDFDPYPAIHQWNSRGQRERRPCFMAGAALAPKMLAPEKSPGIKFCRQFQKVEARKCRCHNLFVQNRSLSSMQILSLMMPALKS